MNPKKLFKNVSASWLGLGTDAITGFILTPIMVHHLGTAYFGLWVLVSAFGGYYGLLDFGTRNAIVRFVARHHATDDRDSMLKSLSSAMAGYLLIALIAAVITGLVAWQVEHLFNMAPKRIPPARLLILIFGLGTAVNFPLSVYGGVLEGLQKFSWIGTVQAAGSIVKTILVIIYLERGYGVVTVGLITILCNLATYVVYAFVAHKVLPYLKIALRHFDRVSMRSLTGFGLVTFWIGIANRLRFQSDSLVIGSLLSVRYIAVFAISSKLVMYSTEAVAAIAGVFTPMFSQFHAQNRQAELHAALHRGNLFSALVAFPIAAALFFLGADFIELWVGKGFSESYPILIVLSIPMCLYFAQGSSSGLLYGIAKHHLLAKVLLCEALLNLALSIFLAKRIGLIGVAIGTAIPLSITAVFFLPWHICNTVEMRLRDYLSSFIVPAISTAPLCLTWYLLEKMFVGSRFVDVAFEFLVGTAIYCAIAWFMMHHSTFREIDRRSIKNARSTSI